MPLTLETVPCLTDNYAYLIHDTESSATAVVDVPEVDPVLDRLEARGWTLTDILITHHHNDHIGGVDPMRQRTGARVTGARADAHRLPALDRIVDPGDTVTLGGETGSVLDAPGHTVGHIAYHFPASTLAFTGDSLMACGCGRLFEGTPEQMWQTLSQLAGLAPETIICSGHEYTQANIRFALSIDPENARLQARARSVDEKRAAGEATLPVELSEELATNPFLRAADPAIRAGLGLETAQNVAVFAEIRRRKDSF
ncbi:MAG: hydroxyacylglutathione hydrolase [Pseudomonadota bacterium]